MKKVLLVLAAVALFTSCGKTLSGGGGEVTGVRSVAFNEPAPYGMVLIKRGSFEMGPADKDSLWGINPETKGVSFDAFWMDETEVTNAKYRQFVYWVRDSIIRERLADPAYGGNDLFKITEDRYGEPVTPHLDWSRPIPWKRANEDEIRAIESVYTVNPVTGEKTLDPKQMVYRYEWYDYTSAALRKHNLDPAARVRNTDIQVDPNEVIMISKDTAYITEEGEIVSTVAIAVSSIVTMVIICLGVLLITPLTPILDAPVLAPAFAQILPALFGGLGVVFVSKNWKIAVAPVILMLALFIFVPALNSSTVGIMVPVGVLFTIGVSRLLYKKHLLD